ncbi:hypothetical protein H8F21_18715 [Pseudomonas sp. P66]|uniref:Uncharacterized protein n=1 Tax=Pseudomonas arcuscaelestis TaxID=2710591 RepID=A0ABS2C182_9PSED|nr:hypothetical protein [Pseudomonas arcuscaelestis]MBM5459603.1 hypothetical protein [Pseudomonas arcuscaelestis]
MSDSFIKGLQRAVARRQSYSIKVVSVKPNTVKTLAKPKCQFDELVYQATIISKMIQLIHKQKGANK